MIQSFIDKKDIVNIQYPVGTHVVFNKKVAIELDLPVKDANLINIDEVSE